MFENRYLVRELHCMKTQQQGPHRFDNLVFKKLNITAQYIFPGTSEIPAINVNTLVDAFDQNSTRRHDTAFNTLRRFVKYLLENVSACFHSPASEVKADCLRSKTMWMLFNFSPNNPQISPKRKCLPGKLHHP